MIFGNNNDFSIEIIISDRPGGEWMFGKLYMYIGGRRIGRHNEETILSDTMRSFEGIYSARDRRIYKEIYQLEKDDIFKALHFSLYGLTPEYFSHMVERFFPEYAESYRIMGDFMIFSEVDVLDPWSGYLVSSGESDKIVYRYTRKILTYDCEKDCAAMRENYSQKIRSIILKRGFFDSVVKEALDYLHEQYAILSESL